MPGVVRMVENSRSSLIVNWALPVDDGGATNTFWLQSSLFGSEAVDTFTLENNR